MIVSLIVVLAIIGGPIVINECYKLDSKYVMLLNVSDILSYYGMILGTIATIIAIIVTINFNRKQIERESYLNREIDKWLKNEQELSVILDNLNPLRSVQETIYTGICDPHSAIISLRKYQMECRTDIDQVYAFLSAVDYLKIKALIDKINLYAEEFYKICEDEISIYMKLESFNGRKTAEDTLKIELEHPGYFDKDKLSFCRNILKETEGLSLEKMSGDITELNKKMFFAYETNYKNLLKFKGEIFESIYNNIQKNADNFLR